MIDNKQLETAADEIYGLENDLESVKKKVAFVRGVRWMEKHCFTEEQILKAAKKSKVIPASDVKRIIEILKR